MCDLFNLNVTNGIYGQFLRAYLYFPKIFSLKAAQYFRKFTKSMTIAVLYMSAMALIPATAQENEDLTDFSLDELFALEVTSVAKKPQAADEAAAAIYVVTQNDIRQSGATTIPEVLRMIPGLEVAQQDGNITAVSARGFNSRFANKLLVLIDGRSIYTSALSGVLWDQHMVPVEDIERIEVVNGPGATLWGANAVNGVINIVTKHAVDSLGIQSVVQIVSNDSNRLYSRYGWRIGNNGTIRVYGHARHNPALVSENGDAWNDGGDSYQFGFRYDVEPNENDAITIQGDIFEEDFQSTTYDFLNPVAGLRTDLGDAEGFNILGRWVKNWSSDRSMALQVYFDQYERKEFDTDFRVTTFDVDFSNRFKWNEKHEIVWGLGYRNISDSYVSTGFWNFTPDKLSMDWFTAFIQDDYSIIPGKFKISLGSKFEEHDITGFEIQPSIRTIWLGDANWALWGAVSRAVRTPSRFDLSIDINHGPLEPFSIFNPGPIPVNFRVSGDPDIASEELLAYELGVRKEWKNGLKLDISAYYHEYDNLIGNSKLPVSFEFAPVGPGGSLVPVSANQDFLTKNLTTGKVHGIEAALEYDPVDWWHLEVYGSVHGQEGGISSFTSDITLTDVIDSMPSWQFGTRSDFTLKSNLEASIWLRAVDSLPKLERSNNNNDSSTGDTYIDLDTRIAWRLNDRVELTLIGENLLEARRLELSNPLHAAPPGFVGRKLSVQIEVRF